MGRTYAGIIGPLACGIMIIRGVILGGDVESVMTHACGALFGFAFVGWLAGNLAMRFADESVRGKFQGALDSSPAE